MDDIRDIPNFSETCQSMSAIRDPWFVIAQFPLHHKRETHGLSLTTASLIYRYYYIDEKCRSPTVYTTLNPLSQTIHTRERGWLREREREGKRERERERERAQTPISKHIRVYLIETAKWHTCKNAWQAWRRGSIAMEGPVAKTPILKRRPNPFHVQKLPIMQQ